MRSTAARTHTSTAIGDSLAVAISDEMGRLEADLAALDAGRGEVGSGVDRFLARPGKRLRPRCVLLAASAAGAVTPAARRLALAAELVHSATLLHDDVIDESSQRRGAATVGAAFGNSVAILAGDWLLMKGLEQVLRAAVPKTLAGLIGVVTEMISAEARQLEGRHDAAPERTAYLRIARQKTAGLFQWSLEAGGRAGGLSPRRCRALSRAGLHLGVGFQIADDLADLLGETEEMESGLFSDLRLGIRTYPLVLALERRPGLAPLVERVAGGDAADPAAPRGRRLVRAMHQLGVVEDTRRAVARHRDHALAALGELPEGTAADALRQIVERSLGGAAGAQEPDRGGVQ